MSEDRSIRHTKHIFRVALLVVASVVALVLARSLFVPESWGKFGPYRGANVAEQRDKPLRHQGNAACGECHDEQFGIHTEGSHSNVTCELCHASMANHIVDDEMIGEMPVVRDRSLCIRCHLRLDARPDFMPQIQPDQHVEEMGGEFGPEVCIECHDPHSPI